MCRRKHKFKLSSLLSRCLSLPTVYADESVFRAWLRAVFPGNANMRVHTHSCTVIISACPCEKHRDFKQGSVSLINESLSQRWKSTWTKCTLLITIAIFTCNCCFELWDVRWGSVSAFHSVWCFSGNVYSDFWTVTWVDSRKTYTIEPKNYSEVFVICCIWLPPNMMQAKNLTFALICPKSYGLFIQSFAKISCAAMFS